jgi:hypothetical protein
LRRTLRIAGLILFAALIAASAFPKDDAAKLRSRFAQESNPVKRAKLMPPLAEAEFREIRSHVNEGRIADALAALEQYRSQAQECATGLDGMGIDAEKHPAGFKQLQISLRESLRRLDHLLEGLTVDEQAPFLAVRRDIDQINRHVLHELFPSQPAVGTPAEKRNK